MNLLLGVEAANIKSTPERANIQMVCDKKRYNSIFSFSLGINFYYFLYSLQIDTLP